MQNRIRVFTFMLSLAAATALLAGGFALEIGRPSANPEAQAKSAVLVVRAYACHDAEKTTLTATAEGMVSGKRQTIPLKPISLSGESTYAIARAWPPEGKWVVTLIEANPKFNGQPSVIIPVDGDSADFASVTRFTRAPDKTEIEAALNTTAVATSF